MTETTGRALARPEGYDPYSAYGAKVGTQGTFLTFKTGEWLAGQDQKELPIGTKLAANMGGLRIGWRRWFGDKLTDDLTELLADQPPIAPRNTLGDNDEALWEKDAKTGKPRDPWQLTNVLELVDSEGESFIYTTGSHGGIGAIGRLCKAYGREFRQRPGMVPIVELDRNHYMHKEYGKTYNPVFNLVDWVDEDDLAAGSADDGALTPPPAPEPKPEPKQEQKKTRF